MSRLQRQVISIFAWLLFSVMVVGCSKDSSNPDIPVNPDVSVAKNISLSWSIPTARKDGTDAAPSEISGYKLHYGTSPGEYDKTIDVGNVSSYILSSMKANTYYITMSAYDLSKVDSALSNEQVITVN